MKTIIEVDSNSNISKMDKSNKKSHTIKPSILTVNHKISEFIFKQISNVSSTCSLLNLTESFFYLKKTEYQMIKYTSLLITVKMKFKQIYHKKLNFITDRFY